MIFTGFLANANKTDIFLASKYIFNPINWSKIIKGNKNILVEEKFKRYFEFDFFYTVDSGRTAIQIILEAFAFPKGAEILVQAYTCVVVTNAIIWAGYKPVFVDINDDYNLDVDKIKNKISKKTKAIIIQHTFGKSADLDAILKIAKENNLKTIEDCAHSLGGKYQEKLLGEFADASMFSFGSDKIISCVRGGAILVNFDAELAKKIKEKQENLSYPKKIKTIQYLLNFLFFPIGKMTYKIKIGKIFLAAVKKFNITGRIIFEKEKRGERLKVYPAKLANSLAHILLKQIDYINDFNLHRKKIAKFYFENIKNKEILPIFDEDCLFLRFPLQVSNPEFILKKARENGIILGDWYNSVIAPKDIDISKTAYEKNSCPKAEKMASKTINLPTDKNIKLDDAQKIVNFINNYVN